MDITAQCSPASRICHPAAARDPSSGSRSAAARARTGARAGAGAGPQARARRSARRRRGAGRGRSCAGPQRGRRASRPSSRSTAEQRVEQLAGGELGLERGGAVQEARLVDDADRIGLAQRRDGDDPVPARRERSSAADRRLAVAEVGAEADVGAASSPRRRDDRPATRGVEPARRACARARGRARPGSGAATRPRPRPRAPRAGGSAAPSETSRTQRDDVAVVDRVLDAVVERRVADLELDVEEEALAVALASSSRTPW